MGFREKKGYLQAIRARYLKANRKEKTKILDEYCAVCNYNRKYAIRVLNKVATVKAKKVGPKPKYHDETLIKALKKIWFAADQPCSIKLKVILPVWLKFYEKAHGPLEPEIHEKLLSISKASIDRVLKPTRIRTKPKGYSLTKAGNFLKSNIPIRFTHWDVDKPGFLEADTVAHCGDDISGCFAWSLTVTDICTGWTEVRALWNKKSSDVYEQMSMIEASLPFKTLGFDSDNGSEFMNHALYDYFVVRDEPVEFTRSRPYRKNDNAHVEQKNWTHVRQLFGYHRLDNTDMIKYMNALYRKEWSQYQNFFIPNSKLISKERVGAKYKKIYDTPKTAYQRVLESSFVDDTAKEKLKEAYNKLDPFKLKASIERKLSLIFKHVRVNSNVSQRK
jgi:hypothetical protein